MNNTLAVRPSADLERYPAEDLGGDYDDGTMPGNVAELADHVVGHRIVSAEVRETSEAEFGDRGRWWGPRHGLVLTLDNGRRVLLQDTSDCCAYTDLEAFLLHPDRIDHIITGVGTENGFQKWHIFADLGDVLELTVGWSAGNPFYYGYGFDIHVSDVIIDGDIVAGELEA